MQNLSRTSTVFRYGPNQLAAVFAPKRVAVIGALETAGSTGNRVLNNLLGSSFGGVVYAVAPAPLKDLGAKAYSSIGAIPESIDLALIVAPAQEVLDAAFRRCGVLRVNTIAELFYMAEILAKQPRPRGPRLTIVTNAGGPGILAADALVADGGQLAPLSEQTIAALNQVLPAKWSHQNPIDVLDDADPERYAQAVRTAAEDANSDGLLVVLTPQAATDPIKTAEHLKEHARVSIKPILASWMGGSSVAAGEAILNEANIPAFPYPDTATRMFNCMWRYSANLDALYEIPALGAETQEEAATRLLASSMITGVVECGRTRLSEVEARQLLAAYRIPSVETHVAVSPTAAVQSAEALGYPVVLKLYSETITHKSDVGGVHLNLQSAADVKKAYRAIESAVSAQAGTGHFAGALVQPMISNKGYEILVGSSPDQQFGPVLRFGLGGRYVEIAKDTSLALPQHLLSLLPHDETKPPCRSREIATHLLY